MTQSWPEGKPITYECGLMLGRSGLFDFHDGGAKSCCDRRALSPDVPQARIAVTLFFSIRCQNHSLIRSCTINLAIEGTQYQSAAVTPKGLFRSLASRQVPPCLVPTANRRPRTLTSSGKKEITQTAILCGSDGQEKMLVVSKLDA